MLDIKSFIMTIGLFTGYPGINNANAAASGDQQLTTDGLRKQEQTVTRNAYKTLLDAESAYTQARHVLLEDKNNSRVSDPEVKRLQQLVNQAALNLKRAQEIAGRIEGLKSHV